MVDRVNGNIFKPDRFGFMGRARHGLTPIDRDEERRAVPARADPPVDPRYAWIDTLFALPEAVLYAAGRLFERRRRTAADYDKLCEDIRECIDPAHRDESLKAIVSEDLPSIIEGSGLAETLHKLRSAGKKLFVLTNSVWDYTER